MKCYQATGILFAKYNQRALMRNSSCRQSALSANGFTEREWVRLHKSRLGQDLEPLSGNVAPLPDRCVCGGWSSSCVCRPLLSLCPLSLPSCLPPFLGFLTCSGTSGLGIAMPRPTWVSNWAPVHARSGRPPSFTLGSPCHSPVPQACPSAADFSKATNGKGKPVWVFVPFWLYH